MEVFNPW